MIQRDWAERQRTRTFLTDSTTGPELFLTDSATGQEPFLSDSATGQEPFLTDPTTGQELFLVNVQRFMKFFLETAMELKITQYILSLIINWKFKQLSPNRITRFHTIFFNSHCKPICLKYLSIGSGLDYRMNMESFPMVFLADLCLTISKAFPC